MLNTALTFCIVGIFSGWVWTLKRQRAGLPEDLDETALEGGRTARELVPHHPVHHTHAPVRHAHHPKPVEEPPLPSVQRNNDGVPVWSIE